MGHYKFFGFGSPPSKDQWGLSGNDPARIREDKLEQFKLVYDYVKFHLGLYLATPPIFSVVAEGLHVNDKKSFLICFGLMILTYIISGADAAMFMGRYINEPWDDNFLSRFENEAFTAARRNMHHTLYWLGVAFGLIGLAIAWYK